MAGPLVTACADHKFVATGAQFASGNFLRVSDDGLVTIICRNAEIGQGVFTGIATLVAEELDADWSKVVVEAAPADPTRYANPGFGMQGTGGSNSIASSYEEMRKVGATARAMLVAAAAQQWKVSADSITVSKGVLSSGSHKGGFGEFVAAAAKLEVPKDVVLKDPKNFTLIGTPVNGDSFPTQLLAHRVTRPWVPVLIANSLNNWSPDSTAPKRLLLRARSHGDER